MATCKVWVLQISTVLIFTTSGCISSNHGSIAPATTIGGVCLWPASMDAVVAAPGNHRVVLENDRVRVLDVTVVPGEREPVHAHCLPSVMYLMYAGKYRDYDAQGNLLSEVTESPHESQFPVTLWLEPEGPHSVENLDTKPLRLLRIEFKP